MSASSLKTCALWLRTSWQSDKGKLSMMTMLLGEIWVFMACRIIWTNQINCLDRRLNRLLSRRHPQGFLFRSTESIKEDHPEVPAFSIWRIWRATWSNQKIPIKGFFYTYNTLCKIVVYIKIRVTLPTIRPKVASKVFDVPGLKSALIKYGQKHTIGRMAINTHT